MKPKAPKKKDTKPSTKSGEVRESFINYEYKSEFFRNHVFDGFIHKLIEDTKKESKLIHTFILDLD